MPVMPGARVLGAKTPNRQVPAIVQSAKYGPVNASGTGPTCVFGAAPTAGNLLVMFASYSQAGEVRTISTPTADWTKILDVTGKGDTNTNQTISDSYAVFLRTAQPGDGTSYGPFMVSGSSDYAAGILYECSNVDTANPINALTYYFCGWIAESTGPLPICYSTLYGCLILAAYGRDAAYTATLSDTGWTIDQDAQVGSFHQMQGVHMDVNPPAGVVSGVGHTVGENNFTAAIILALTPAPY